MHQDRFYISITPSASEVWLEGKEAHHILHVKRAEPGDKITLFNGKGLEYLANIIEISHNKLKVLIEQSRSINREADVEITIAFSAPKGKLAALLIQKCTELGVKALIPIHCKRSIVDIRNKAAEKTEKWNKIVVETSKQCKRNFLTKIENVISFNSILKTLHDYDLSLIACTELNTGSMKGVLDEHPLAKKIICLIGPEGGFTNDEIEIAEESGCIPVNIGNSTLRVETAAIAISSMLLYAYSK